VPAVLITGASAGIGREFAHICARDGHEVVLVARSCAALEHLAAEVRQQTGRLARVIVKDLSNPSAPQELFDEVRASGIEVDVLINNAGFGLVGRFWELSESEQMEMVRLNVGALTQLSRLFLPIFIQHRRGGILNVASTAAFQPGPLMSVYYATKAYVVSFSEAIYNEARDYGLTVTCLCPGPTRTEFDKRAGASATKLFASGRAMDAATVARIGWNGFKGHKPLVIAGRMNAAMAFLTRFAPIQFTASMARRFQEAQR
jgi:short-subunit dehydrogenase